MCSLRDPDGWTRVYVPALENTFTTLVASTPVHAPVAECAIRAAAGSLAALLSEGVSMDRDVQLSKSICG